MRRCPSWDSNARLGWRFSQRATAGKDRPFQLDSARLCHLVDHIRYVLNCPLSSLLLSRVLPVLDFNCYRPC